MRDDAFTMPDGARLPYRAWLPAGPPSAVVLALHGFNDSRDAWEYPGAGFAAAGLAVYAPDQRGFGEAPGAGAVAGHRRAGGRRAPRWRGWCGRAIPGVPLVLMGESMGAAVLMVLATGPLRAGGRALRAGGAGGVGPGADEFLCAARCGWRRRWCRG